MWTTNIKNCYCKSMSTQHFNNLTNIFLKAVEAVKPKNLLSPANKFNLEPKRLPNGQEVIEISGNTVNITNKKCHVVGFGKAVLGMAVQLERCLGDRIEFGILSIPKGSQEQFKCQKDMQLKANSVIQIWEGADNNQPDTESEDAAKSILSVAQRMTKHDILFVLISGGGSALLPSTPSPITLQDKMYLVNSMSNQGATIQEMNTVRLSLSDVKGGQLAVRAARAHAIISFVISDIVEGPVDLIAGGPTHTGPKSIPWQKSTNIIKKYNLWDNLETHVQVFIDFEEYEAPKLLKNNFLYVVGNNRIAANSCLLQALLVKYNAFIASTTIQGEVSDLVKMYANFLEALHHFKDGKLSMEHLKLKFPFDLELFDSFARAFSLSISANKPFLLITAGEPTIKA